MRSDAKLRGNLMALVTQYVASPTLIAAAEEKLWQTVYDGYQALHAAYTVLLEHHEASPAASTLPDAIPQILLNLVDTLRLTAQWHYLRYQAMPVGGWLRLHELYRQAEALGCAQKPLQRYPNEPETSVMCCYLEALLLDSLNHTSMLKAEIQLVANLLGHWCRRVTLEADYDKARHLFFVALDDDCGGRRLRQFRPSPSNRYWDTDCLVTEVERLLHYLKQDSLPDGFTLPPGTGYADCRLLAEHMLAEWSRYDYLRQRRHEERSKVVNRAQVVHGILNICQHLKNVFYSRRSRPQYHDLQSHPLSQETRKPSKMSAASNPTHWHIREESPHGLSALVDAGMNLWLRPGKLILLDYAMDPDLPALGIVRSIRQEDHAMRRVGIEIVSYTMSQVRLKLLARPSQAQESLSSDVFLSLAAEGEPSFPALYLPADEEKNIPATLLLPNTECITGSIYALRTDTHYHKARLGRILERRDDWVRAEVALS